MAKGAIELVPTSPGYYSRLFVVWKASGSWRPVIDLSRVNKFVLQTRFKIESNQSVLRAVRGGNWMVSIDLRMCTFKSLSIPPAASSFVMSSMGQSINLRPFVSASPQPLKYLPGSWLLYR